MDYLAFVKLPQIEFATQKEDTLRLWHHIYTWIIQHGYADVSDTPDFVKHVQLFRKIEASTISRHLLEMSRINLIVRRVLRRKLPEVIRTELNSSIHGMLFGGDMSSLPTSIVRYALPGQKCSIEFKAAKVLLKRNYQRDDKTIKNYFPCPDVKTASPSTWDNPAPKNY